MSQRLAILPVVSFALSCAMNRERVNMNNQNETKIDDGANSIVADASSSDNRFNANAFAAAIVSAIVKSEDALSVTAKQWGAAIFRSVINDKVSLDTLIGESKLAAGYATLAASEAGRKAKGRLNVYFSNARLVAEKYEAMSDEAKEAILSGATSIHYLASQFRDVERKALAEAKKAEAAGEAGAIGADMTQAPVAMSLKDMAETLLAAFLVASNDDRNEAYDAIELLTIAVNEAIEADAETGVDEVKLAA